MINLNLISPAQHAWYFIEKSKAMVLLNNLKDADAKVQAQIPAELLEKEYNIRIELLYLQRTIAEKKVKQDNSNNQEFINECLNKQFEYNLQWQALIEQFEKEYPDYFNLKHQTKLPEPDQIREYLSPDTMLINYFVGQECIYISTLTKSKLLFYKIDKPAHFDKLCHDVLGYTRRSRNKYFAVAHELYQLLVLPILPSNEADKPTHLIVIPDGKLREIPFETLLTEEPTDLKSFANQPYLLNQFVVSYQYSAALWHYSEQRAATKIHYPDSFIGFAPIYPDQAPTNIPVPTDLDDFDAYADILKELSEQPKPSDNATLEIKKYRGLKKRKAMRSVMLNGTQFYELLKSEDEVKNIVQLFEQKGLYANAYLHHYATKQHLLEKTASYKYILIAAHNDFNPQKADFSGILLSPEPNSSEASLFTVNETYQLNLKNAALVILSCCDSGRGIDIKGEGTMAMNRGLLFSGADRIIYTLFKIPDAESAILMTNLFKIILDKTQKTHLAQALTIAKRHFIQQAPNLSPEHWAGFVLLG